MTAPGTPAFDDWRVTLKARLLVVVSVLALWVVGIETKLVYLQIFQHADLLGRAERQQERTQASPAKRGDILDRRGRVLATSADADTIIAVPTAIVGAREAANKLCDALGDCDPKDRRALADKLGQRRAFAYVRRQVTPDQARELLVRLIA